MATHDYVIANGTGAAVRSDLNNALAAIVSNNSSSSEPGTTYAYQWWADTNANVLKIRNSANDGWITLRELDGTMLIEDGSASTPGLAFADDVNTGIFSPAADQIGFATGGAERLEIGSSEVVFNDPSNDVDFRVESNGNTHMLFVDAGNDRVGIGTGSPSHNLDILSTSSGATVSARVGSTATSGANNANLIINNGGTGNATLRFDYESSSNRASIGVPSSTEALFFTTSGDERARIDQNGKLIVGHSSARTNWNDSGIEPKIVIEGAGDNDSTALCIVSNSGGTNGTSRGALLTLARTKGTSVGTNTAVDENTALGIIEFKGNDGTSFTTGALIKAQADGSVGTDDMPGRLVFSTTADGAAVPTERVRIDSSGRLLINHTVDTSPVGYQAKLQLCDTSFQGSSLSIRRDGGASGPTLIFTKSRGTTKGANTIVQSGDNVGTLRWFAADGTDANSEVAQIRAQIDGTPGSNDTPGRLIFKTTSDGASDVTERMRINSAGGVLVGKSTTSFNTIGTQLGADGAVDFVKDASAALYINRLSSDGDLVNFYQNGTLEGTISVSGTTVSYNGGHLTRWSQLASSAERTEILRGSVLSNLDEMCEWAYEAQDAVLYTDEDELPEGVSVGDVKTPAVAAGTEDNEQLNRMKVSDVEGDVNVSGVFQAWDDDDDTYTNDFYCAMTGDFVIRIAQGTTVARGDLLMSAGDGTAKPQDDDIVRSKTIAKVTSTTVSTTYSDGSYCVPCVLMAC